MDASCKKILPSKPSEINVPAIDGLDESSPQILISEKEYLELKSVAGYWRAMHAKVLEREKRLQQTIKKLKGQIRDLRHRIFGKKGEKSTVNKDTKPEDSKNNRPRGQQPGSEGHGLTERPDLPVEEEKVIFSETPICPDCGRPYTCDGNGAKESIRYEVNVKAHVRKFNRQSMKKGCCCKGVPNKLTAPIPPNVIPKSPYGISIWEAILLTKFHYSQPTNRLLNQYGELGLPISPGTVAGGLKTLKEMFQPVYDALYSHQMTEARFHNDESGWKVFETVGDKIGNRWWLWVCRSVSVVYFQIAPGRGANVPIEHFKNIQQQKIIVICDRYSAYKSLARQMPFIVLAFCWAHVRRDYLDAARKYPALEEWALCWVEKFGELYHINNLRRKVFDQQLPIQWQPASFKEHHEKLIEKMDAIVQERDAFLISHDPDDPDLDLLSRVKYKILTSLKNHWEGLSVFIDHPEVPMDNNAGEKAISNPVTGRKNFYGSGSLWSSQLAAIMFSIFQTLGLWKINCNHWLRAYLIACAENHGKAPEDLSAFLPWEMDEMLRQKLSRPPDTS
ncbi:MAG: IS66 family transposase [Desulfobacula sp.]|jgi:transposase|nr:IS66 family transposase [Desulfobacula sp.]